MRGRGFLAPEGGEGEGKEKGRIKMSRWAGGVSECAAETLFTFTCESR